MLRDLAQFEMFWLGYQAICQDLTQSSLSNHELGIIFEGKIAKLINNIYNANVYTGHKLLDCRGVNRHQFDIRFKLDSINYFGESKFSDDLQYIKDGVRIFTFSTFQRIEHLRLHDPNTTKNRLILFTNSKINKTIINDCLFNNVIFINPVQPYIPLALHLASKKSPNIQEDLLFRKLSCYSTPEYAYEDVCKNTEQLSKTIAEEYFSFIRKYELSTPFKEGIV